MGTSVEKPSYIPKVAHLHCRMLEQVDSLTKQYSDAGQAEKVKDITQSWLLKIRYINFKSSMEPS